MFCSDEGKVRKILKVEPLPDGSGHFFNLSKSCIEPFIIHLTLNVNAEVCFMGLQLKRAYVLPPIEFNQLEPFVSHLPVSFYFPNSLIISPLFFPLKLPFVSSTMTMVSNRINKLPIKYTCSKRSERVSV